jgi:hypothetical protein
VILLEAITKPCKSAERHYNLYNNVSNSKHLNLDKYNPSMPCPSHPSNIKSYCGKKNKTKDMEQNQDYPWAVREQHRIITRTRASPVMTFLLNPDHRHSCEQVEQQAACRSSLPCSTAAPPGNQHSAD